MANLDHTPEHRAAPRPERSATRDDFHEALSEAQLIGEMIGLLAGAEIGGQGEVDPSMFDWLATELGARLERVEAAGSTLVWGCGQ